MAKNSVHVGAAVRRRVNVLVLVLVLVNVLGGCGGAARSEERTTEVKAGGLAFFAGTWELRGEDPASGTRFEMRYVVRPVLGGTWLEGRGAAAALGVEVRDVWGRDAATGEIVRTIHQSNGAYGTVRARGWDGDTLVLEGEVHLPGGVVPVRETIRRTGDDRFEAVWEARKDGAWVTYSIERLTRARTPSTAHRSPSSQAQRRVTGSS